MTPKKIEILPAVLGAKVVVCSPIYGWVPAEAAASVTSMMVHERSMINGYRIVSGTYVHASRNQLIEESMALNPTHLLFLDSDMVVPEDTCRRLLRHNKDVVSGLYFMRMEPHYPVLRKDLAPPKPDDCFLDKRPPNEFCEVSYVGFGCVLVSADVIKKAVAANGGKPVKFFSFSNDDEGEDIYFCRLMHRLGIPIYVDPTCECGHVGTSVVTRKTHEFGSGHVRSAG